MSQSLAPLSSAAGGLGKPGGLAGAFGNAGGSSPMGYIGNEPTHSVTSALHGALMGDPAHGLGGTIGGQAVHPITQLAHQYLGVQGQPLSNLTGYAQQALGGSNLNPRLAARNGLSSNLKNG